jgi:putative transposase
VRHHTEVHAYCLMTNHVHLLLSPGSADGCQVMMKELGHRYSQYFNRAYGRAGPLWGGRYYSCIAESALYVLACYRYIELNPVRAGLVAHPAEYRWSSHRVNAEGKDGCLISPHEEFLALGTQEHARRHAYKTLIADALDETLLKRIRESTVGGYPLASETFSNNLGAKTAPSRPGPQRRSVSDTDP